jgi:hypothetical protein
VIVFVAVRTRLILVINYTLSITVQVHFSSLLYAHIHIYTVPVNHCCDMNAGDMPGQKRFLLVLLECSRDVLADRLRRRRGHFFNMSLLQSQLDSLEPLLSDSDCELTVDGALSVDDVIKVILSKL